MHEESTVETPHTSGRANNIADFTFHTSVKAANSSTLNSFYSNMNFLFGKPLTLNHIVALECQLRHTIVKYRLWSQDLAVALNFRHILNHLSHTVRIPERLAEIIKIGRTRSVLLHKKTTTLHVIRILPIITADIGRIRSEVIRFFAHGRYLFVRFGSCTRPIREGGFGVLNPQTQYYLLQTRWILPLLDQATPLEFAGPILSYLLRQYYDTSDPLLPVVFPELRSSRINSFSIFPTFFRAMKILQLSLEWSTINRATAQELPLSAVFDPSYPLPIYVSCGKLRVNDAFSYYYTIGCIRRRHTNKELYLPEWFSLLTVSPPRDSNSRMASFFPTSPRHLQNFLSSGIGDVPQLHNLSAKVIRAYVRPPLAQMTHTSSGLASIKGQYDTKLQLGSWTLLSSSHLTTFFSALPCSRLRSAIPLYPHILFWDALSVQFGEAHFQYIFNDVPFVNSRVAAIAVLHTRGLELEEHIISTT
ncbi:hypothetical protein PHYBLDRAFT_149850 [Phycomyces blakesleeanus NRRL 1555(-)]|uniref:Uncharacterized protein n=1 Tax=Phycomyces blakesleeanus (strain ATCC 8743b / DSM 1359 / FGSC 10004 / NBRC 33097 / NRRL 1555) TaxID=763407 RepID=A0A167KTJ0_PHYB8|nr:hypothetical protein PHYBLDRAFT_149850 [Phycomyces blakesleeanus NRRL 1555(-)]OAD68839.1 hypothetical protein PHYBLDRAFT_149850 [Phycomyces blakesleeanus NRRL 1555(-)]|eukprot:XP_018286879.1 hypothetical protein PHYBLDRAFT_149850 [Phycomyces blakesleeanus NRRL 1555(-)]